MIVIERVIGLTKYQYLLCDLKFISDMKDQDSLTEAYKIFQRIL